MSILDELNNPKDATIRKQFWLATLVQYGLFPLWNCLYTILNPASQISLTFAYVAVFISLIIHLLILIYLYKQTVQGKKTGFLTFLLFVWGSNILLTVVFLLVAKFHSTMLPITATLLSWYSILQTLFTFIWLFTAWRMRKLNQLTQLLTNISTSPEALALVAKVDITQTREDLEEFITYIKLRTPYSWHQFLKPLESP